MREFLEYHSTRILLLFSFALVGLGSGLSCYLSELYPHQLFGFLSGFIFYSLGSGLLFGLLKTMAVSANPEPIGIRMAVFSTLVTSSAVIGSLLVGWIPNGDLSAFAQLLTILAGLAILLKGLIPHAKVSL